MLVATTGNEPEGGQWHGGEFTSQTWLGCSLVWSQQN